MRPNDKLESEINNVNSSTKCNCFILDISDIGDHILRNLSIWNNEFKMEQRDSYINSKYSNQKIYYTNFEQLYELMSLSVEEVNAYIEIRSESDLLIVQVDKGINPMRNIVSDINHQLKSDISKLSYTYSKICNFVRSSESITAVESPAYNNSNKTTDKIRSGDNVPIDRAKLKYKLNNNSFFIIFDDMNIKIPIYKNSRVHSDRREYIMQVLEHSMK